MSQFADFSYYLKTNLENHPESFKGLISLFIDMTNDWPIDDLFEMMSSSFGISEEIDSYLRETIDQLNLEC